MATPEEARAGWRIGIPDAVLAGERDCVRIPGFDLGNSPLEMRRARGAAAAPVVLCTTNGTGAFAAVSAAAHVYSLAAVNFTVSVARARAAARGVRGPAGGVRRPGGWLRRSTMPTRRDASSAQSLAGKVRGRGLTDAALAAVQLARHHGNRWDRLLRQSAAGRRLIGLGFGEDVRMAGRQDEFPVLAAMKNGRITGAT